MDKLPDSVASRGETVEVPSDIEFAIQSSSDGLPSKVYIREIWQERRSSRESRQEAARIEGPRKAYLLDTCL